MGSKNKPFNRPQQGQNNNQRNNQPVVEQKPANAPLANVVNSAPAIEYASEAEVASLITLLDRLEESAQQFGDVAVEAVGSMTAPIRALIIVGNTISDEDKAQIEALKAELEAVEMNAGARSHIPAVADFAIKALEEGTDEICVKWRENQELISTFGGEETQQMTAKDYKSSVETLAFQQVWAFTFYPVDMKGCPEALVAIDEEFSTVLNSTEGELQPEQPQIAAV